MTYIQYVTTSNFPEVISYKKRIMNPLSGGGIAGLFSTHPATEERVGRLREMAGGGRGFR